MTPEFGLTDSKRYPRDNSFNRGRNDFKRGNLICPFAFSTSDGREWQRGWNAGYEDNLREISK